MTKKELYAEWVRGQEKLPVFFEPWWLDAVCAGREWDVIIVESRKSKGCTKGQCTKYKSRKHFGGDALYAVREMAMAMD